MSDAKYIEVCRRVAAAEHLRAKTRARGAIVVAGGGLAGALIGGPLGMVLGASVGAVTSLLLQNTRIYRSLDDILSHDLTVSQLHKLAVSVQGILRKVDAKDVSKVLSIISSDAPLKESIIKIIQNVVEKELKMDIIK